MPKDEIKALARALLGVNARVKGLEKKAKRGKRKPEEEEDLDTILKGLLGDDEDEENGDEDPF